MPLMGQQMTIMSFNVENLFDANNDSLKQDEEFLPESTHRWTWGRYWRKIEDISRVIMGIGGDEPPALIALQEVENDSCMIALTRRGPLWSIHYKYVMTDSPDHRGIDVALMYQPEKFRLLGYESRRVPSEQYGLRPTRDILYVRGCIPSGDTLHIAVCHLPSRAGNSQESRRNRKLAVNTLCQLVDSLLTNIPNCRLVIMGDFNATLRDKDLKPLVAMKSICPLTPSKKRPISGSYRFQGNWAWIDHILVSQSLIDNVSKARLYTQPWMQRTMSDGSWYPRRTYLGTNYNGGVSDHVPVYIDFAPLSNSPEGEKRSTP